MWCKILLIGSIQVLLLSAHPMGTTGSTSVWDTHFSELPQAPTEQDLLRILGYYNKDSTSETLYRGGEKRAFTLLSRWRPFSALGRNNPSIREHNRQIFNDLDIETRAMLRPVGQPLRWGR